MPAKHYGCKISKHMTNARELPAQIDRYREKNETAKADRCAEIHASSVRWLKARGLPEDGRARRSAQEAQT